VNPENALAYLDSGAVAVAIGGSLVPSEAVSNRQFADITRTAEACARAVAQNEA
jgi:2-keto-3-deoxy-6-phosphogluconate aldolase